MRKGILKPVVVLSDEEKLIAEISAEKKLKSLNSNPRNYDPPSEERKKNNLDSTMGEMALAKHLNMYWSGIDKGAADVGFMFEVRTTPYRNGGLIVYSKDFGKLEYPFYLITGKDGHYTIQGWLFGRECCQESYWQAKWRNPAYLVNQSLLNPPHLNLNDVLTDNRLFNGNADLVRKSELTFADNELPEIEQQSFL